MRELFHGFGFLGAWLLVAGSLRQAFLELQEEEFEQSRVEAAMREVPPQPPISTWWWLLPPVRLLLAKHQADARRKQLLVQLSEDDYRAMLSFIKKASAWILVAAGGICIAAKETYELLESLHAEPWLVWLAIPGIMGVCLAYVVISEMRERSMSRIRSAANATTLASDAQT